MTDRRSSADADRDEMPPGPRYGIVHWLAGLTAVLGVLMIVGAIKGGGGPGSYGVLVGALFVAAGVTRLRLLEARRRR